jgi:hypothetical protein
MDSVSKKPIQNAKVTILCWYDAGWDKTDYQSVDIITKSDGNFSASFDKGYKVIIAGVAPNYRIEMVEQIPDAEILKGNLFLSQASSVNDVSKINLREYIVYKGTN